ncbi:hypothetical protein Bbelb_046790 [Branchiostoma belcheri]|nr:hypothetical protein Bbelb_046790 [Branchiostoma belcheri]
MKEPVTLPIMHQSRENRQEDAALASTRLREACSDSSDRYRAWGEHHRRKHRHTLIRKTAKLSRNGPPVCQELSVVKLKTSGRKEVCTCWAIRYLKECQEIFGGISDGYGDIIPPTCDTTGSARLSVTFGVVRKPKSEYRQVDWLWRKWVSHLGEDRRLLPLKLLWFGFFSFNNMGPDLKDRLLRYWSSFASEKTPND